MPLAVRRETALARWSRRCLTIPLYTVLALTMLISLPLLITIAAVVDLVNGRRFGALRCVLALTLYIVCEAFGLLAAFVLWIVSGVWAGRARGRFVGWNYALQNLWARALFNGAVRIFGLRVQVEGDASVGDEPLFVFIRHASTVDTLLPAVFVEHPHGFRLRYVMKRELLWDPCLDIVGQRTRHLFVRRDSVDSAGEIAAVRALAVDLRGREGVLLYPEGTRATAEKRARVVRRIAEAGDRRRLQAASRLQHTLPPRLGGALALLEARPDVAALFVAHVGFDGVASLRDLWRGALVGRDLRVKMWKVEAADIPLSLPERVAWLDREWTKIDQWIGANLADGQVVESAIVPATAGGPDGDPSVTPLMGPNGVNR
jgi:1-acyl-sn-glycerol-3-phosphate acyltransferase